jgi:hypothetical protein
MFWFTAALSINVVAILLIIGNAVYDSLTLQYSTGHNDVINLIGAVLAVVVVLAFSLKSSGKLAAANILLWIPATPLVIGFGFSVIYFAIIFVTKPDWK